VRYVENNYGLPPWAGTMHLEEGREVVFNRCEHGEMIMQMVDKDNEMLRLLINRSYREGTPAIIVHFLDGTAGRVLVPPPDPFEG
jgi:hypothetical protein